MHLLVDLEAEGKEQAGVVAQAAAAEASPGQAVRVATVAPGSPLAPTSQARLLTLIKEEEKIREEAEVASEEDMEAVSEVVANPISLGGEGSRAVLKLVAKALETTRRRGSRTRREQNLAPS